MSACSVASLCAKWTASETSIKDKLLLFSSSVNSLPKKLKGLFSGHFPLVLIQVLFNLDVFLLMIVYFFGSELD